MIINSLLIGKGKGSAGNITVNQLKGQTILKQKASMVANPRTDAQVAQRDMVSRAVYFWQLFGNVLKSGWTSLLPFCSEYNTFVSTNSGIFKSATFTKESYRNLDSIGATATKGRFGTLSVTPDEILTLNQSFILSAVQLQNIAKVGDKIKLLIGAQNQDTMNYAEVTVTASLLASSTPTVIFNNPLDVSSEALVFVLWLETADGKESTTSKFTAYLI
jgi:hypothetical protein